MDDLVFALALFVPLSFIGATVYGITGFGAAMLTMPVALHFVPLPYALAVFSLVDVLTALRVGLENPREAVVAEVVRIVPSAAVGILVGVTVLVALPRAGAMVAMGSFISLYAIYSLVQGGKLGTISRRWVYLSGFGGGVTGTLFGAGGPPYAIYMSLRPYTKAQFRATLTMTSIFSIAMRVTAFGLTGLYAQENVFPVAAASIPAALLGTVVASKIFRVISREVLLRAVAVLLLATGASLLWRATHLPPG